MEEVDEEILKTVESVLGKDVEIVDCEKTSTIREEEIILINGEPVHLEGNECIAIKDALITGKIPPCDLLNQILLRAGILKQSVLLETSLSVKSSTVTTEEITIAKNGKILDEKCQETKENNYYISSCSEIWEPLGINPKDNNNYFSKTIENNSESSIIVPPISSLTTPTSIKSSMPKPVLRPNSMSGDSTNYSRTSSSSSSSSSCPSPSLQSRLQQQQQQSQHQQQSHNLSSSTPGLMKNHTNSDSGHEDLTLTTNTTFTTGKSSMASCSSIDETDEAFRKTSFSSSIRTPSISSSSSKCSPSPIYVKIKPQHFPLVTIFY